MKYGTAAAFRAALEERLKTYAKEHGVPVVRLRKIVTFDRLLAHLVAALCEADLRDRSSWPSYLNWMVRTTARFREVFGPRIREMDLTTTEDLDEGPSDQSVVTTLLD